LNYGGSICMKNEEYKSEEFCTFSYFTIPPFSALISVGATKISLPSEFSAINIIPCDSIPFNFLGARFTNRHTCLPIIASGE